MKLGMPLIIALQIPCKSHWQGIPNHLESGWIHCVNPESTTVSDYLAWAGSFAKVNVNRKSHNVYTRPPYLCPCKKTNIAWTPWIAVTHMGEIIHQRKPQTFHNIQLLHRHPVISYIVGLKDSMVVSLRWPSLFQSSNSQVRETGQLHAWWRHAADNFKTYGLASLISFQTHKVLSN